jgi:hypothetical protein
LWTFEAKKNPAAIILPDANFDLTIQENSQAAYNL